MDKVQFRLVHQKAPDRPAMKQRAPLQAKSTRLAKKNGATVLPLTLLTQNVLDRVGPTHR
jgi:hypothetical protein